MPASVRLPWELQSPRGPGLWTALQKDPWFSSWGLVGSSGPAGHLLTPTSLGDRVALRGKSSAYKLMWNNGSTGPPVTLPFSGRTGFWDWQLHPTTRPCLKLSVPAGITWVYWLEAGTVADTAQASWCLCRALGRAQWPTSPTFTPYQMREAMGTQGAAPQMGCTFFLMLSVPRGSALTAPGSRLGYHRASSVPALPHWPYCKLQGGAQPSTPEMPKHAWIPSTRAPGHSWAELVRILSSRVFLAPGSLVLFPSLSLSGSGWFQPTPHWGPQPTPQEGQRPVRGSVLRAQLWPPCLTGLHGQPVRSSPGRSLRRTKPSALLPHGPHTFHPNKQKEEIQAFLISESRSCFPEQGQSMSLGLAHPAPQHWAGGPAAPDQRSAGVKCSPPEEGPEALWGENVYTGAQGHQSYILRFIRKYGFRALITSLQRKINHCKAALCRRQKSSHLCSGLTRASWPARWP